jgi:hypothetical protein
MRQIVVQEELTTLSTYIQQAIRFDGLVHYVADIYGPQAEVVGIVACHQQWILLSRESLEQELFLYEIEVYDHYGVRCQPDLSLPYWRNAMREYPDAWEGAHTEYEQVQAAIAYLYKYQVVPCEYLVYEEPGYYRMRDLPHFERIRLYTDTSSTSLSIERYVQRPDGCHA